MSRTVLAAALFVVFTASGARAQILTVTADKVNLRAAPTLTSRVVVTLSSGALVERLEKAGEWYRVQTVASGIEGYVHGTLVAESDEKTSGAAPKPAGQPEAAAPSAGSAAGLARRAPAAGVPGNRRIAIRGFGSANYHAFAASKTFKAVLGSSTAQMFGGGVQVLLPLNLFAQVEAEWFQKTGQRVFVFQNEVFPLGIEDKVTIMPVAVSGGYRFPGFKRFVPYAGGGVSYTQFKEQSGFAGTGEDTSTSFIGYHGFGGVEVRIWRWISVAGEGRFARVPNALKAGAAAEFGESDLGGLSARLRVLVGK